jgi:hypothetical protein
MDTPALTKWIIWCAIAAVVCAGILVTIYLWHTWPTSSGPGVATSTTQEQAPASPATLNTSAQELQQSEAQAGSASSSPAALNASQHALEQAQLQASQNTLEQAQRANPSGASAASSTATQAQLQASQNALQQVEAQQKVQEQ